MTKAPTNLHDLPAERAILGGCLLEPEALDVARELVQPSDFYSDAHREIWRAALTLRDASTPLDTNTLRTALELAGKLQRVGGDEYLLGLTDTIPTVANIEAHAAIVRDLSTLRAVRGALDSGRAELEGAITDVPDFLDRAESLLASAVNTRRAKSEPVRMDSAVHSYIDRLREQEAAGEQPGYKTGFTHLDWYLAGMMPAEYLVLAGRPGLGKTALALQLIEHVARTSGKPALFQSVEMPTAQLIMRALSSESGVDGHRFRTVTLRRDDWPAIMQAASRLAEVGVYIDDEPGVTLLDVKRNARRVARKHGGELSLIVIDYLQLLKAHTRTDGREEAIGDISRGCKAMAKEFQVPVLALSAMNRGPETRPGKDKRPTISDLRESGAIESDADTVLLLYRDEVYNADTTEKGIAEVIIGKARSGRTGTVKLLFRRELTRFENLADNYEETRPQQQLPHSNGRSHAPPQPDRWSDD